MRLDSIEMLKTCFRFDKNINEEAARDVALKTIEDSRREADRTDVRKNLNYRQCWFEDQFERIQKLGEVGMRVLASHVRFELMCRKIWFRQRKELRRLSRQERGRM